MAASKYCIHNRTRDKSISSGVNVINATREPLAILKVLIEGLAANETTGIWLTNMVGIPMVPRISPFDLVYLDKDYRVVKGVALLPSGEFPPFKKPSVSALVLPLKTLISTKTKQGDQFVFTEIGEEPDETEELLDEEQVPRVAESPAEIFPVNGKVHSFEPSKAEEHAEQEERTEQASLIEASLAPAERRGWVRTNNHHPVKRTEELPERTEKPAEPDILSNNHHQSEETEELLEKIEERPEPDFLSTDPVDEIENSTFLPERPAGTTSVSRFTIRAKQEMENDESAAWRKAAGGVSVPAVALPSRL